MPIQALRVREDAGPSALGDQCDLATAEAFARRLTPAAHRLRPEEDADESAARSPARPTSWTCSGSATCTTSTPAAAWRPRPARDRLRVPIGLGEGGGLVHLDIKESAQQGMGPHGLVIGATGSGKSEFLRTLVLGLAMTHSPEQLNMVLVDFKGGATFAGMSQMPHVSAVITNLAQELTLVDRMQDALSGEMVRRQELLREAGNYASIRDYEKARAAGEPLRPDAVAVHRRRRVLRDAVGQAGVHRPVRRHRPARPLARPAPAARLASGWRRAGCAAWSRTCPTGSACAPSAPRSRARCSACPMPTSCPPVPGLGYLKPDPTTLLRFKAAYVSGPPSGRARVRRDEGGHVQGILPFTIAEVQAIDPVDPEPEVEAERPRPPGRGGVSSSTWPSTRWSARARRPTRSGCRRSTCPTPSTS